MSLYNTAIHEYDNYHIKAPIGINNAGYYKFDDFDSHTERPNGRQDYLMIFIKSGVGYFHQDDNILSATANQIVIYKPNEPQFYDYYQRDKTKAYWIHFGGTAVEELLKKAGIFDKKIIKYPATSHFVDTINFIISELRQKEALYDVMCVSKLIALIADISRYTVSSKRLSEPNALNEVKDYIINNYNLNTSIKDYATMCNMSEPGFFKAFKQCFGTSPQQFKKEQRIRVAENLLLSSSYTISQISQIVGYSDSLYFSKTFKQINGLSPTQFRKVNQT